VKLDREPNNEIQKEHQKEKKEEDATSSHDENVLLRLEPVTIN